MSNVASSPRIVTAQQAKAFAKEGVGSREDQLRAALRKSDPLAGVTGVDRERLTDVMNKMADGLASFIEDTARRQGASFDPNAWHWHSAPWEGGRGAKASDAEIHRILQHLVIQYELAGFPNVRAEIRHATFDKGKLERSHVELGPNLRGADPNNLIYALPES